jgi:hypothetical protein
MTGSLVEFGSSPLTAEAYVDGEGGCCGLTLSVEGGCEGLVETHWVARSGSSGNELSLWFVARDGRGGVNWAERRVRVR